MPAYSELQADPYIKLLQRKVARHNWQVAGLSLSTAVGAVLLWGAAYFTSYWMVLLGLSAVRGGEAAMPAAFTPWFKLAALGLLFWAWLDHLFSPDNRARDRTTVAEVVKDCLLLVPRLTWSVWWNLSAWLRLSPREYETAASLVEQVVSRRRLPLHQVPVEIPDEAERDKVVLALLLLRVLEIWRDGQERWLRAPGESAGPALAQESRG